MTEKTLTTENIKPALDALRGELAPWPVVAKKQDRLNTAQLNAANSGITSSLVAQIIANTAAIRALESAITGTGLRALVVASLPAVGTTGILYIVPVTTYDPETDADVVNYSNEYIWIPVEGGTASEGHYEQVGQTGIVINNGQLTITVNGTSVGTFTANQSGDTTAAITVPTNADYVDRTTDQTVAGVKTFSSTINGTAAKAIADEDGTSIKTGYVNVAGNQTVSGQKTWSGVNYFNNENLYQTASNPRYAFKSSMLEIGVQPSGHCTATVDWLDSNDVELGYSRFVEYNNSIQTYEVLLKNKAENDSLSPAGNNISASLQLALFKTGSSQLNLGADTVVPASNNSASLGSSSYQWSSVYAQSYYYNGTAWGLDKANTWTGGNTFSAGVLTAMVETSPGNTGLVIRSTDQTWEKGARIFLYSNTQTGQTNGSIYVDVDHGDNVNTKTGLILVPNAFQPMGGTVNTTYGVSLGTATYQWAKVYSEQYFYNGTAWGLDKANTWTGINTFTDAVHAATNQSVPITENPSTEIIGNNFRFVDNDRFWGQFIPVWGTDGSFRIELGISNWTTTGNQGYWTLSTKISKDFGTLDFYTSHNNANLGTSTNKWKTLNGINPGALSLPDNSNAINLDTTNWGVSGELNHYAPTINGWLCISVKGGANNGLFLMDTSSGFGQSCYGNANETVAGRIKVALPVIASRDVLIIIHADSNSDIYEAKLYPCLGNV